MTNLKSYTQSLLYRFPTHTKEGERGGGEDCVPGCPAVHCRPQGSCTIYMKQAQICDKGYGGLCTQYSTFLSYGRFREGTPHFVILSFCGVVGCSTWLCLP